MAHVGDEPASEVLPAGRRRPETSDGRVCQLESSGAGHRPSHGVLMRWWLKLRKRRALDRDLQQEIAFHREMRAGDADAPSFGNESQIREEMRHMWTFVWLETAWQDLRYAARSMRRNPAFFLSAILILALGIGVNTAVFTVVRAVVLNPLPFPDAQRLVMLWKNNRNDAGNRSGVAPADFLDFQQQVRSCAAVAAFTNTFFDVTGVEEPYRVIAARVSSNFFATLSVHPAVRRDLTPLDDQPGANGVATLSHSRWPRRIHD